MVENEELALATILDNEISWIAADETRIFDSYYNLGINSIDFTVEKLRAFYVWRMNLDGATETSVVDKQLLKTLKVVSEHGEQPSCWVNYLKFTSDSDTFNSDSRHQWRLFFESVLNNSVEKSGDQLNTDIVSIARRYMDSVKMPYSAFYELSRQSELLWLQSSQNRSEFDNVLYETIYRDLDMSPAASQRFRYEGWLHKTWWKKLSSSVPNDVKEQMHEGLVSLGTSKNQSWLWKETYPIDLAFGVSS